MSGSHSVNEGGEWKLVRNATNTTPAGTIPIIHCLNTSHHRIYVSGIEFTDYAVVSSDSAAEKEIVDLMIDTLNAEMSKAA